jgi:hypothetical protein
MGRPTLLQWTAPSVPAVQPYLNSALRYRWFLGLILALVWGSGLVAAYVEYKTTFEARAVVWVLRAAQDLTTTNPSDPFAAMLETAASQQSELLSQLLQTRSVIQDVVDRTSLRPALSSDSDPSALLDETRRHFRVQTLGTNMISITFTGRDPHVAVEMVNAAMAVRTERVAQARLAGMSAVGTLYRREFEAAQNQALEAQKALDEFSAAHRPPLDFEDEHHQAQLRLTLDFAQVRLSDLKGRIDRAAVAPALLEMSGVEFQVVDEPREDVSPRGGSRPAAILAGVAFAGGVGLAALLVFFGALLANHIAGPADVGRLAPARLFATVPRVVAPKSSPQSDLRGSLIALAFRDRDDADRARNA